MEVQTGETNSVLGEGEECSLTSGRTDGLSATDPSALPLRQPAVHQDVGRLSDTLHIENINYGYQTPLQANSAYRCSPYRFAGNRNRIAAQTHREGIYVQG